MAHVLQANTAAKLALTAGHNPFAGRFELQLFTAVAEAQHWLRQARQQHAAAGTNAAWR